MNFLRRILWPRPRPEPVVHVPNHQHAVAVQHWHLGQLMVTAYDTLETAINCTFDDLMEGGGMPLWAVQFRGPWHPPADITEYVHMVLAERRANEIAERRHRAGTRVSV